MNNLPCLGSSRPLELCTPECTRWTQINNGQPLKIFHDSSTWDPNYFTNLNDATGLEYFQPAIDAWNDAWPCGTLFELTNNFAEAEVEAIYEPREECDRLAQADCFCRSTEGICNNNIDNGSVFGTGRKARITTFFVECNIDTPVASAIGTQIHELGHILGMTHVFDPDVPSIMNTSFNRWNTLQDWDISELLRRYPCDCQLTEDFVPLLDPDADYALSSDLCHMCGMVDTDTINK